MSDSQVSDAPSFAEGLDVDLKRTTSVSDGSRSNPDLEVESQSWNMEFPKDEKEALTTLAGVLRNAESKEDVVQIALKVLRLALTREVVVPPRRALDEGAVVHLWK